MAPKARIAKEILKTEYVSFLKRNGTTPPKLLCQNLQISQPTLSRVITLIKDQILIIGKAKETQYGIIRKIENTRTPIPIFEILKDTTSRVLGFLEPIEPKKKILSNFR